jgi:hypothetical protein
MHMGYAFEMFFNPEFMDNIDKKEIIIIYA